MCGILKCIHPYRGDEYMATERQREQIFLYNKIVFILLYKVHTGTTASTLAQYALNIRIYYYHYA